VLRVFTSSGSMVKTMPGVVVRSDDACKQQAPVTASSGVAVCFHPIRQTVTPLSHNTSSSFITPHESPNIPRRLTILSMKSERGGMALISTCPYWSA